MNDIFSLECTGYRDFNFEMNIEASIMLCWRMSEVSVTFELLLVKKYSSNISDSSLEICSRRKKLMSPYSESSS